MTDQTKSSNQRASRPSVWVRLRPFLRRDLKSRLTSAGIAVAVLVGLFWLGVSALTKMDSSAAHSLRVEAQLESAYDVCGGHGPACSYDDREQAENDRTYDLDRQIRAAVLRDLDLRIDALLENLEGAEDVLNTRSVQFELGADFGGDETVRTLLANRADLRPLESREDSLMAAADLRDAGRFDGFVDESGEDTKARLLAAIESRRETLKEHQGLIQSHRDRESDPWVEKSLEERDELWSEIWADTPEAAGDFAGWVQEAGGADDVSASIASLSRNHRAELAAAVTDPYSSVWQHGWDYPGAEWETIHRPTVRYESPIEAKQRRALLGTIFLGLASVLLLVVGPVVTATATAREREAGTLPVLRMTGLSAGDLALAMAVGPNVFALVTGAALTVIGGLLVATSGSLCTLGMTLGLLFILAPATHLTAIGLGDALGQRVNALLVGALMALGIVIPGVIGSVMTSFDVASTGLLLGPLPSTLGSISGHSGIPGVGLALSGGDQHLGSTILVYALLSQTVLGLICLNTWRRRVERAWAPLFRPQEGLVLAVLSIGCSALSMLDISGTTTITDFDTVNAVTFASSSFLLPVLAWLLISSLRRPARAGAVATQVETRRAFIRFNLLVGTTLVLVGGAYQMVLKSSGLGSEESELMIATLTQVFLLAETVVATLLWASRKRDNKLRVFLVGSSVALLQALFCVAVYGLEVEFVARTNEAAKPFLLGMGLSGYWIAFMVLLWTGGAALIYLALRKQPEQGQENKSEPEDDSDDDGYIDGRRLLH